MSDLDGCGQGWSGDPGVVGCFRVAAWLEEREVDGAVAFTSNRLGYGAMRLTGPGMWGEYPDRDAGIALLRLVAEAGVTFIDTADA